MEKCGNCELEIVQQRESIKCSDCSTVFHTSCARSATGKVSTRGNFKCEGCAPEPSAPASGKSGQDRDLATVLEAIADLRKSTVDSFANMSKENASMWTQMQEKIEKVVTDIHNLNTGLGNVKQQFAEIEQKMCDNGELVEKLQERNLQLCEKVTELESEIQDLQQYSRLDNIIVTGIPLSKGEDIHTILEDIAGALNINYDRYDIAAAHRLSMQTVRGRPPAIVVKFATRAIKTVWMNARKHKKILRANEVHRSFPDSTVFFNEHLTVHTRDIFNAGRQLVKEKKLAFVWVSDGRVLAKQTPDGKTIRVTSVAAMKRLPRPSSSQPAGPESNTSARAHAVTPPPPASYAAATVTTPRSHT